MAKKNTAELRKQFLFLFQDESHLFNVGSNIGELADKCVTITEEFYGKKKVEKTLTAYTGCIDIYNNFIIAKTGLPGKFDGTEGKAMKAIIAYLGPITHIKTDQGIIDSFSHILKLIDKWEPFHQKQLKLSQINSNLINIINAIKNGNKKLNNYEQSKYSNNSPGTTMQSSI